MKLTFRIEYRTAWGETIAVMLEGQENEPIVLSTSDGIIWEGSAEMLDAPAGIPLTYRYGVFQDGQCIRRESGTMAHIFCPSKKRNCHYILNDAWKDLPSASHLYTSAFSGNYTNSKTPKAQTSGNGDIVFRALCPCLHHRKQVLGICGNREQIGAWNSNKAIAMEEVQANDRMELMRNIPVLLQRINNSLPTQGVGANVLQFSDWLVDSAANAGSFFPQIDKNEADKIRKLFLARTDLSVDDLDSNKNIRLQEKLRDILAPLQQDWRNYQSANETERHKLAKQLKTSFNPDKLADELRSVMHGLDSLAVGGVKEFKRLGLDAVEFLFENENILLARSPQSLRQSSVDNSVRIELVKEGKQTWVDLKDEVDNYLSHLSMRTEKDREVLAQKITKFASIIGEKGYRWDTDEPLEVDALKNVTGIKVIGPDRSERTLNLQEMRKLMLEGLEIGVQLNRRPIFSTIEIKNDHDSSSGI